MVAFLWENIGQMGQEEFKVMKERYKIELLRNNQNNLENIE